MVKTALPVITRSRLVSDLSSLGLVSGDTVMLHASVKAVGWIVGGPEMVLRAILDAIDSPDIVGASLVGARQSKSKLAR